MNQTNENHEPNADAKLLLADVLDYIENEGRLLYTTRMQLDVDYDIVMEKVNAFKVVAKHIKKQLKNGC